MFAILNESDVLKMFLTPLEKLILLVSTIGHDLDHPGTNNYFQIATHSTLSLLYNDLSPLENHHCSMMFMILKKVDFLNLKPQEYKEFRKNVCSCILATDPAHQQDFIKKWDSISSSFNWENKEHRSLVLFILFSCFY